MADEKKKLLVFLKAQEAGVRGESGGERGRGRGEEAGRAATQLSDTREEAPDTRARRQESRIIIFFFTPFVLDYSLLDILLLGI